LLQLFPAGGYRLFHAAIENGMKDFFLALEVEVNGAVGNAGLAGDVGNLGVEITVVSETRIAARKIASRLSVTTGRSGLSERALLIAIFD